MELKEDITERKKQADRIVGNPKTSPEELTKWYDLWSKTYEQDMLTWGYKLDKHLDEFEDFVRVSKDSRVLDVAAGTGLIGQKLKERGYGNIEALDGSKGMLAKAKTKEIYKNHIHALMGSQPLREVKKDTYDVLICVGGHSVNHITFHCYESLAAITKPGGYIYFLGGVEWLADQREEFEDNMRKLQEEGVWRWVLMKESPVPFFQNDNTLTYAFKVLK